ncbi:MAG: signal recognition particle protein Srp19 [Candidatus Bathyarchaeota archaeon]|nr:signal recognition particle protein Srp19 [Candidatus Bathyarchaeota archaeon]
MRKQKKVIIWPAYFDSGKTRKEGRRVNKDAAVHSPKIDELEQATIQLNLEYETIPDKGYPKTPWNKTGMLHVEKDQSKEHVINQIAKQLQQIKAQQAQTQQNQKPTKKRHKK